MASSILNSDDGVISGTSGLKSTGGDDGNLVFQSKGTETARINTDKQIVAAAGTASLPIYSTTGDTNTGIFFPAADTIAFTEGGAEAMRIDSSGRMLVGTTTTTNNFRFGKFAVVGVGNDINQGGSFTTYGGTTGHTVVDFQKSRGTTDGSMTVVASGDRIGSLVFRGSDGSAFKDAAFIAGEVDGTPGANDMPGRLAFFTTPDGSSNAIERMRIDNAGRVTTPAQPGFRAGRVTSTQSVTANSVYIFNTTSGNNKFNTGSHYNTSTGVFTAPITGVYLFSATVIIESASSGQSYGDLIGGHVNGGLVAYSIRRAVYVVDYTGTGGFYTDFIHFIVSLAANDTVDLRNGSGVTVTLHANANYAVFEGYLLG
jgi:hypothetical protein